MATSSLSVRIGTSLTSSGNIHISPTILNENELLSDSHSNNGSNNPLMTVDTSHHSLLSSIPTNVTDYGLENRKMLCLQSSNMGFQQQSANVINLNKDDFDEKFGYNTNLSANDVNNIKTITKLKQEREILNNDIIVSEGQNDVTLEYMDLDEFLHENGLSNVCKGEDPQHTHVERHYPINLQHRGIGVPESNDQMTSSLTVSQELLINERVNNENNSVSHQTSSLTCIIPSICGSSSNLLSHHNRVCGLDIYQENNKQCSPGSSNSLASPSSACSLDQNIGICVRGRRRSSTKSIDSNRSMSPTTNTNINASDSVNSNNCIEPRVVKRSKKEMVPDVKKVAKHKRDVEFNQKDNHPSSSCGSCYIQLCTG
ncbi:uncharacterized protein [Lepeophtheirus salmonis]|uniref:uncharacterized protein isoform X1 n=1 Tax=Lepeophtheirus salmonis TaxID=72036 RepID=UPI003AF36015